MRWPDIDWEKGTLLVKYQLVWKKGGRYELASPKTRNSNRTIILGKSALEVLQSHKALQEFERTIFASEWEDHNLVLNSMRGKPLRDNTLYQSFNQVIKEAGFSKIRFHELRHTAATKMLNYGIPVIIVSKRLGHAQASITLGVYGHLIPSKQEGSAVLMGRLMTPKIKAGCTIFTPGDNKKTQL